MSAVAEPIIFSEVRHLHDLIARRKWQDALRLGKHLLSRNLDPEVAETLGKRLLEARYTTQAVQWMKAAAAAYPNNVSLHCALADILVTAKEPRQAAAAWINVLELDPLCSLAHAQLPKVLMELGLFDEARVACNLALQVVPDSVDAHETLGRIHEIVGDRIAAIERYSTALTLAPGVEKVLKRRALLHVDCGNWGAARADLEQLAIAHPKDAEVQFVLSRVLASMGETAAAIHQLRRVIALRPKSPGALTNLGSQLRKIGHFEEAERSFKTALIYQKNNAIAWNNLANLQVELSRVDEADAAYSRAVENDAEYTEAHVARAMLRLLQGRFSEGWHEYEWRLQEQNRKSRLYTHRSLPAQSWKDGNILLCAEQGAGDTFQFIRYALDVVRRGGNAFLECPKALHVLMKEMPQLSGVIAPGEEIPPHAYIVPLMSMPLLCGTNEATIPAPIPYLKAPEGRTLPSSLRDCDKRKVGFVWSGNAAHANDRNRSIPAQKLMKLAANPDIQAFSLQVGGSTECSDKIVDLAPFIRDYGDTAAFLDAMDLVISVDTSVAHLAGALGRRVWLLLPTCNDWRWMLNRDDSPWYPTMRIFRQTTLGDWDSVLSTVADALRIWSEGDKQNER